VNGKVLEVLPGRHGIAATKISAEELLLSLLEFSDPKSA